MSDQHGRLVPLCVKVSPDLTDEQLKSVIDCLLVHGVDGVVATNSTTSRDAIKQLPQSSEQGGLSGQPLLQRSNAVISAIKAQAGDALAVIGVGGILSADDANSKLTAGADLIQLYTGLIYKGPSLVRQILRVV